MELGRLVGLVALLTLTAGLSGCLGGEEGPPDSSPDARTDGEPVQPTTDGASPADQTNASAPGARPSWTHGDWWTYDVTFDLGFGTLLDGPTTLVLHDTQDGYSVAAADRTAAIVDQHFDLFAVGDLSTELNPDGGSGFRMFDFPLEDGKTWTTDLGTPNGTEEVTLTATRIDDAGDPAGPTPGYRIHGETDGGASVTYTYSPEAQWITSYELVAPSFNSEPRPILTMTLTKSAPAYEGTFVTLEMETLYFREALAGPFPDDGTIPPVDRVQVPGESTFVQRVVGIFGFDLGAPSSGAARIDLFSPENEHESYERVASGDVLDMRIDEPPIPGEWTVSYQGAGTTVMIVGFFGFTETVTEFTSQSHAHHA